jgi:hypothetical protein
MLLEEVNLISILYIMPAVISLRGDSVIISPFTVGELVGITVVVTSVLTFDGKLKTLTDTDVGVDPHGVVVRE